MEATSFYIELRTGVDYKVDDYHPAAARMAAMLTALLCTEATLTHMTHDAPRSNTTTDLEVCMEEHAEGGYELVGKAVIDILAPAKLKLDKGRLSKAVKAHALSAEWPKVKILKKLVPPDAAPQFADGVILLQED